MTYEKDATQVHGALITHQASPTRPKAGGGATLTIDDKLRELKHVALDMDGTIYRGGTLFPFTNDFLQRLRDMDIGYSFLTNNSSKSAADYEAHLEKMGVKANREQLFTSTQATIEFLREELPDTRKLFVLGTTSMQAEIAAAGYQITEESVHAPPDAVVVGFDTELNYPKLCRAAYWIKQEKPFVATHPDLVCPTDQPTVLVDCGAVCAALTSATGKTPVAVPGKPDPRMLRGLLHRLALQPYQLAMVGDRLYTDVAMAHRAGVFGVVVLTGEATRVDAERYQPAPDLIVSSIAELGERLRAARRGRGT